MKIAAIYRTSPGTNHQALIVMRHPRRGCWGWFSHAGDGLNKWGFSTRREAVESAREKVAALAAGHRYEPRIWSDSELDALQRPVAVLERPNGARNPWPTVGPCSQWVWA